MPKRLFQAEYPEMAQREFGPLAAEAGHKANVPPRFTRFFGREDEMARLREMLFSPGVRVPRAVAAELGRLRTALRERRKIRFHYVDKGGAGSSRTIWPLGLFFWGKSWSVAGYCELRKDFRNFSAERVTALELLEERFEHVPGRTLRDLFEHYQNEGHH